jgi:hypothetical protein
MLPEPAAGALYDARRRLYYAKPVLAAAAIHVCWPGTPEALVGSITLITARIGS